MAKTAIADIIVPTLFESYAIERTAVGSVFVGFTLRNAADHDGPPAWCESEKF